MDTIKLTHDKLSVDEATNVVTAPTCGAVSIFVGTTRDNFESKKVVQLEYEAYDSMAEKVMKELCAEIRSKWTVENIAIYHRLGVVPVCEASVIIAVSSEHRGESLAAVQFAIHSLKASVPIWKKEVYDEASGSNSQWKENKESVPAIAMEVEIDCEEIDTINDKSDDIVNDDQNNLEEPHTIAPELVQIKATPQEVRRRIEAFIERKREDVNRINIRDFCTKNWLQANGKTEVQNNEVIESCARIDAVLVPRKDSKSHLRVRRVFNSWGPQTRGIDDLRPEPIVNEQSAKPTQLSDLPAGVEERLGNIEHHLKLKDGPVPVDVYARLKRAEERILYLESISPEYFSPYNLNSMESSISREQNIVQTKKKKVYSSADLKRKLQELEALEANMQSDESSS